MSIDYRKKVLKPLILKRIGFIEGDEQMEQFSKGMAALFNGRSSYVLLNNPYGITSIVLGQSPKSQKKIRIAK